MRSGLATTCVILAALFVSAQSLPDFQNIVGMTGTYCKTDKLYRAFPATERHKVPWAGDIDPKILPLDTIVVDAVENTGLHDGMYTIAVRVKDKYNSTGVVVSYVRPDDVSTDPKLMLKRLLGDMAKPLHGFSPAQADAIHFRSIHKGMDEPAVYCALGTPDDETNIEGLVPLTLLHYDGGRTVISIVDMKVQSIQHYDVPIGGARQ